MSMYPFTPTGVADFLSNIYALSNHDLALEADAIWNDFPGYVSGHFTLDTEQSTFLGNLPEEATEYLGERCSFCFIHRLHIILIKPEPPVTGYSKIVETEDKTQTETSGGTFNVSGSFEIHIVYIPD